MEPLSWITLGGIILAGFAYAVGATMHVAGKHAEALGKITATEVKLQAQIAATESSFHSRILAVDTALREKMEGNYNLAVTKLEVGLEKESKGRHDLANEMQRSVSQLVIDDKALASRINDLSADMVRKSDLAAHEARMTAVLQNIQASLQNAVERLDSKVDELRDRVHA